MSPDGLNLQDQMYRPPGQDMAVQEMATFLYQLHANQQAMLEILEESFGPGGTGVKDVIRDGDTLKVDYNDGRTKFLNVAIDLPEREQVYYPWTYGLVYDNRNEASAVTSRGGAYTLARGAMGNVIIRDEDPIPWDSITRITVSERDGDGVNRGKMFQSATFDGGGLIIALRRATGTGDEEYVQVAFQMTGDVIDHGDDTYSFPVDRTELARTYDVGDIATIKPPLAGTYQMRLLLPGLPDIQDFPSGRTAGWFWAQASAETAALLEDLGDDAWPDEAVAEANAATPGDNVPGDIVTLVRGSVSSSRGWDGTRLAWVVAGEIIDGNLFVHGTIQTDALAALAVTAPKILLGNGLIVGDADKLELSLGDTSLQLTEDGLAMRAGLNSGLIVTPSGVVIGVSGNALMKDANGLAVRVATNSGIIVGASGLALSVEGASIVLRNGQIALNARAGGGLIVDANGVRVGNLSANQITTGTLSADRISGNVKNWERIPLTPVVAAANTAAAINVPGGVSQYTGFFLTGYRNVNNAAFRRYFSIEVRSADLAAALAGGTNYPRWIYLLGRASGFEISFEFAASGNNFHYRSNIGAPTITGLSGVRTP